MEVIVGTALMSATMLPSALPLLRLDAATAGSRAHTAAVALGYASVWAALGSAALPLAMLGLSSRASAAALGGAAVYQVSPLARRCLQRCRTPLARIAFGWRDGVAGGFRMGVHDGLWCAGCCAGLLVGLISVGIVSVWGMLAFGAVAALLKVASEITTAPDGAGHALRIAEAVRVRASTPVESDEPVACIVPGYDRVGAELYADEHAVDDEPFGWELTGNCAFAAGFEYVSSPQ